MPEHSRDNDSLRKPSDALDRTVSDVRDFLHLHRRTGTIIIRVNSNQGGITSADFRLEEKPN